MAFPILDQLQDLNVPFLMATGALTHEIPPGHLKATRLSKPYDLGELRRAINMLSLEPPVASAD